MRLLIQTGLVKPLGKIEQNSFSQLNFIRLFRTKLLNNKITEKCFMPVIIPCQNLILKIMNKIPFSSRKNMDRLIYYKIQSDIIPDLQKLNYFYIILNKNTKTRECTVALFFYKAETINQYRDITEKSKIYAESYIFDICLFIEYIRSIPDQQAMLYLQVYDKYTYLGIKHSNRLHYLRLINSPSSKIKSIIQETMRFYSKSHPDINIREIVLVNSDLSLNIKGCQIRKIKSLASLYYSPAFSPVVPRLMPDTSRKQIIINKGIDIAYHISFIGLFVFIGLLVINMSLKNQTQIYQYQLEHLESSLKRIEPFQQKYEKFRHMQLSIKKVLPYQSVLSAVLYEISSIIPQEIKLKNLFYDNKRTEIKMQGLAPHIDAINIFIKELNKHFRDAELVSTRQEKFGSRNLIDFVLKFTQKK